MKSHAATAEECERLWPAVRAERLMTSCEELLGYRDEAPWRVRVAGRGEAALLGPWREHLEVLAMLGVWCSERHVVTFAEDAIALAAEHGFAEVLSPLLPIDLLDGYRRAGMCDLQPIVAIQGVPKRLLLAPLPPGVALRGALPDDVDALATLDAACFDDFWRFGSHELADLLGHERCALAQTAEGEVIGYTLATVNGGVAVLSRLCTAPAARRGGVGAALLADVGAWCREMDASTLTLCTQEDNVASRALYASSGLVEVKQRYSFALREI